MKSIGGYLGFEIGPKINALTDDKHLFNSGRSACLYFLQQRAIKSLWVPYYICGDLVTTLKENGIAINFYNISRNFEIKDNIEFSESILYVNYFGVMDGYIKSINKRFKHLLIDNSQALFNNPINELPTFYSPRKFLGIPDGGMLFTPSLLEANDIPIGYAYEYSQHLLKQIDQDIESGFKDFQLNEKRIVNAPIRKMSNLSERLIKSVNVSRVKNIRSKNYQLLDDSLRKLNRLTLDKPSLYTFPLLVEDGNALRAYLNENKIYTPQLWADQLACVNTEIELEYIDNIVHLPIDQRYEESEMKYIIKTIQRYYE